MLNAFLIYNQSNKNNENDKKKFMSEAMDQAEKRLFKLITEVVNKPLTTNEPENNKDDHAKQLSNSLKDSFRALTEIYIHNNEWARFFALVDLVEQTVSRAVHEPNVIRFRFDDLLRLIGDIFYSVNYRVMAFEYYKKSIALSHHANLHAVESLENLIDECMERWHYRMINDSTRNRAYSMAIFKRLQQLGINNSISNNKEIRILDIGSGTGLLSALCLSNAYNFGNDAACGVRIYACEENEFFYEISRKFLKSIDKSNQIKVINKNSNELDLDDDLDRTRVDLIVTEIFDDGLLGEGCLNTLYNALYVNKLVRTSSALLTQSARVFICAVESARLRRSSRYYSSGVEMSATTPVTVEARCLNNSERFEAEFDSSELNFEPYTSENLNFYDDLECLTQPEEIAEFRIRFDDEKLLEKLCKSNETIRTKKHLKAIRSGTLDALVVWFELYLDDNIVLTNCPSAFKKSKIAQTCQCWDQAVYNVNKLVDKNISQDQMLAVDCKLRNDCFLISMSEKKQHLNTELTKETIADDGKILLWLSEFELRLLNNQPYQDFFSKWFQDELKNATTNCGGVETENRELVVGYLSNSFSQVFFDLVLKYKQALDASGEKDERTKKKLSLRIEIFVNVEQDFAKYFASTVQEKFKDVRVHLMNELSGKPTYELDYLLVEPVDVKFGVLKKHLLSELTLIKSCNSKKDLKIFPHAVRLKSTVIESDSLIKCNQLQSNKNLCIEPFNGVDNIDLEPFLVDYYTQQQYSLSINMNVPNYKQLTEIAELFQIDFSSSSDGLHKSCNEVDEFTKTVADFQMRAIESGRADFVLYWFEMIGSTEDNAKPFLYSPVLTSNLNDPDTYWNQMVAFSLTGKNCEIDLDKINAVNLDYSFKNQMFFVNDVMPIKTKNT